MPSFPLTPGHSLETPEISPPLSLLQLEFSKLGLKRKILMARIFCLDSWRPWMDRKTTAISNLPQNDKTPVNVGAVHECGENCPLLPCLQCPDTSVAIGRSLQCPTRVWPLADPSGHCQALNSSHCRSIRFTAEKPLIGERYLRI